MAKLTMINNVRTSRAPLMRRALLSTARTIRNIPRNLAEAGAVMMGYPMFMVTPHDEFDGWADCPSDITLTDKPTTAFFNGAGLSPVSQVLSVTDTEYSLKPETVDTLDKMVKRGQVRQALAKTLGKPVEVKGKELLAYIAYNGPFSSQQADRLNDCVNETEIHIFNRAYILLHIIHRPLRESPRNIMMVAELLKAQDWQDLAKHLLVQDSQDQQAILDYVGLHLGQEKAQELTVLMKKAPDEQFEESVEEPIAKPAEEQLSEPARQELEERLWLDVAAFAQDPAVSQSYFNPERILQECGQSGFRRGAWLANAEYSIAGLRERIAFNNKQLEGFLRLFGTLKDTRDEGKRTQLLQQIKTYQEAVDAAESGIEGFTKNLRPDSIHIQRLKSAVQEHLGAERKTLDQEHKAEMEKIKREAAGDQRFLAALRETQPRIDKITADLMDCEAELPKWLTARQALLEAGAQRLVAMPQGVAFEALAAGIDPDLLQRVDKFFEVDGIKGHTIKVRLKPEVAQNSHFSVNAIFIFSPTELLSFAQYADQDLDFASAYLLAKKDSLHDILKPNNQEIVDILSACEDIAENGIRLIPSIVHRLNILAELFYLLAIIINERKKYTGDRQEDRLIITAQKAIEAIVKTARLEELENQDLKQLVADLDRTKDLLDEANIDNPKLEGQIALMRDLARKIRRERNTHKTLLAQGAQRLAETPQTVEALATGIDPNDAVAYYNLGIAYSKKGQYDLAIEAYQKIIKIKPNLAEAHNGLGVAYYKKGQYDLAIETLKHTIRIKPDEAIFHLNLGCVYHEKDEYDLAIAAFKEAIRINPDFADAHWELACVYADKNQMDLALAAKRKARQLNPGLPGVLRIKIANLVYPMNKINPDDAVAHYNLGNAYYKKGQYDLSIEAYQKAIQIKPDYAKAHYHLGNAYYRKSQYDLAIEAYKKAIEIKPDYLYAHTGLGTAYYQKGQHDLAIAAYQKALELKPDLAEAQTGLEMALVKQKETVPSNIIINSSNDGIPISDKVGASGKSDPKSVDI